MMTFYDDEIIRLHLAGYLVNFYWVSCFNWLYALLMKFKPKHPIRTLLTGLLALLPLAATLLLLGWIWSFLAKYLGPSSSVGQLLSSVGVGVTESELVGYLLGVLLVIVVVYGFGLLVERGLQRGLAALLETVVKRIPVVRTIYDVAQKLVALVSGNEDAELASMSPVWLHFGGKSGESGKAGTVVLGFLSSPQAIVINNQSYLAVLVPTAPVPIGGGLLYVPPEWVEPANIGMEAVTSIYVSMGVTSAQHLQAAIERPAPKV
jgi:uncharacterized membrane protein